MFIVFAGTYELNDEYVGLPMEAIYPMQHCKVVQSNKQYCIDYCKRQYDEKKFEWFEVVSFDFDNQMAPHAVVYNDNVYRAELEKIKEAERIKRITPTSYDVYIVAEETFGVDGHIGNFVHLSDALKAARMAVERTNANCWQIVTRPQNKRAFDYIGGFPGQPSAGVFNRREADLQFQLIQLHAY